MSAMLADRAPLGTLVPGNITPKLKVPRSISRPEYLFHDGPEVVTASDIKDEETIEKIRVAGRIAADAMYAAGAAVAPGVTTDQLDRIAHDYMCDHGAYPSCLDYMGFPKSICTSFATPLPVLTEALDRMEAALFGAVESISRLRGTRWALGWVGKVVVEP